MTKRVVVDVLSGESVFPPPIWMMRQAGRYLPEYRQTRPKAGSFLDLCYDPDFATEVTLQPIRRFGFDAAILFSDILVVPHALGRDLDFEEGRGPVMTPLQADDVARLDDSGFHERLAPVYETVRRLRRALPATTTLIGFCGAPWTVATYMIAGQGSADQAPARLFSYRHPAAFARLIDIARRALGRIPGSPDGSGRRRGADLRFVGRRPRRRRLRGTLRRAGGAHRGAAAGRGIPRCPSSAFRAAPAAATKATARRPAYRRSGSTGRCRSTRRPACKARGPCRAISIRCGWWPAGRALAEGVEAILERLGRGPLVFNLGHGITPETPIAHVEAMIEQVRGATR